MYYEGFYEKTLWTVSDVLMYGVVWIFISINLVLSAERFYYKLIIWVASFWLLYIFWGIIFEIAGWEIHVGERYISAFMDWSEDAVLPLVITCISIGLEVVFTLLFVFIKNLILIRSGFGEKYRKANDGDANSDEHDESNESNDDASDKNETEYLV